MAPLADIESGESEDDEGVDTNGKRVSDAKEEYSLRHEEMSKEQKIKQ